ncbi:Fatty acid oxidation complex subunit alpha [Rubrobacter xylanophilus DSM 9941]|uniref:3-hydroxyacyl-CoA dehydrogenase NAD-binding domain-containing protein n=1 Tax=Rubrobacter xylanophilus TaxID=49319 RepID=UPI001C642C92|nr:3-hydroxyacyl-CoA dehydrogenase NAD-binding domain-containing protein [Rubrobacter xylanophilus]QYJ15037.1 Fatty acid oxidation complex subunit alpha [Rubrobacter xylanophilus DSM 9941]
MAERVAVVGAGTMGSGIVQSAAASGFEVVMVDVSEEALARGMGAIRTGLGRRVERGRISSGERDEILGRISTSTSLEACAGASLVVEAVVEDLGVKREVFSVLERVVGEEAVLATNTSSLSVARISASTTRPERVVGMHFFNPAPVMRLVEVVRGPRSGEEALSRAEEVARRMGKTPVRVSDTPGFIVNRVARPFYLEALRLVETGESPARIDASLRKEGFRMGPLELADLIGHDVNLAVSESLFERYYCHPRFRPSHLQRSMVEAGLLGRKTGRGFYDYGLDGQKRQEEDTQQPSPEIALRIISCVVNEAFFALEEGVASAEDIDRAMQLGANYPKGPFAWARKLGVRQILDTLDSLRNLRGDAYVAAPGLRDRAAD